MIKKVMFSIFIWLLLPVLVFASYDGTADGVKCYYSIPVQDDATNITKNIEMILHLGTEETQFAACRIYYDDIGAYNSSPYREGCTPSKNATPASIESCEWHNCWDDSVTPGASNFSRNGRFIQFRHGDKAYKLYYDNLGICPNLYGSLQSDTYSITTDRLEISDWEYKAVRKVTIKNGKAVDTGLGPSLQGKTKNCEYPFEAKGQNKTYNVKMLVEKISQISKVPNYNVTFDFIGCDYCNPITANSIQSSYDGNWQESFESSFNSISINVDKATMLSLIDGNSCLSNDELYSTYYGSEITLEIYQDPNINLNPTEQNCTTLFGSPETPGKPAYYMQIAFEVIKYAAIVLLIVLSIMDYVGAVASSDDDAMKKATNKMVIRLIICVVLFVLPTLLKVLFQLAGIYDAANCGIK